MQIVINIDDIPKNDHERWAMSHGIILPKGHGRLIDADELRIKSIDVNAEFGNEWWCVDCDDIELAPTVLEADKEI